MRARIHFLASLVGCSTALTATKAWAGMPSPVLSDWAEIRIETISFFIVVILLGAGVVCLLWNSLAKDFTALPRLKYRRALAMVVLLGLFLAVLLTMIAAARELLTPGAWQKQGVLYKVSPPPAKTDETPAPSPPSAVSRQLRERYAPLAALQKALWAYATAHDGRFPEKLEKTDGKNPADIQSSFWGVYGKEGMRYLYVPGQSIYQNRVQRKYPVPAKGMDPGAVETEMTENVANPKPPRILVYEPDAFDGERLALRTDGKIVSLPDAELHQQLSEKP